MKRNKKKNAGFSMVEILIALAIFAILMVPIVSGIISSLKMTTNAKELQYRNEFAENLMEHIKSVPIEDITNPNYYYDNIGTTNTTFSALGPSSSFYPADVNGDGVVAPDETLKRTKYTLKGQTVIGTENKTYNYRVEIDNNYYVQKKVTDNDFLDPNNLALGIVEDIDYNKVALIDGTIHNYDVTAATSLKTKKLQVLKETDEERYRQQMEGQGTDLFAGDQASRMITIEVSGNSTKGYTVRAILDYMDLSGRLSSSDNHVQYIPYAKTFESKLPNIYLMYNPGYYNTDYNKNDYIAIDTSGLEDSNTYVNLFLVEIASTYSQDIVDSGSLKAGQESDVLYNTDVKNAGYREDTKIHLVAAKKASSGNTFLNKIRVYHNIGDNTEEDGSSKRNQKSSIYNLWYKASAALTDDERTAGVGEAVDGQVVNFLDVLNAGLDSSEKKSYVPLTTSGSNQATVASLNTATEESRGLYEVKIWLEEADDPSITDIDTTAVMPILQGTKGGNES